MIRQISTTSLSIIIAILLMISAPAGAQDRWVVTASDNRMVFSLDTSRVIKVSEGVYRGFIQMASANEQYWNRDRTKPYRRQIDLIEFNCKDLTYRSLSAVGYDQNGSVVGSQDTPETRLTPAVPGSYAENTARGLCGFAATRFQQGLAASTPIVPIDQRWLVTGNTNEFTIRIDTSRLEPADSGRVHVFDRWDYAQVQRTQTTPVAEYSYTIGDALYDCENHRMRYLSIAGYNASGTAVTNQAGSSEWTVARPQSVLEASMKMVCSHKRVVGNPTLASTEPVATGPRIVSSGSAFPISRNGYLLTNDHVTNSCSEVRVRFGSSRVLTASIVIADAANDIALLKVDATFPSAVALRAGRGIRPGDDVVAVGFPLAGLLADQPNVTTGTVSALAGIRNDARYLQITSPVQPGNSGGPLFDLHGHLIGIVASKLNALAVSEATGDIPQNVNFAINTSVIRAFLDAHSVRYALARSDSTFSKGEIGERGRRLTHRVDCWAAK